MFDGFVDLVFRLAVEGGQLCVREDAQRVEFLLAVWADALDRLEVVSVLLGRRTNALEVEILLALLDPAHGLLLFGLGLLLVRCDGDLPKEVHAGSAQLDAGRVRPAFVGWQFAVVELEVDDHLAVLAHRQTSRTLHAEGRFIHREAAVIALVVVVDHLHPDVAHPGDGDAFSR